MWEQKTNKFYEANFFLTKRNNIYKPKNKNYDYT